MSDENEVSAVAVRVANRSNAQIVVEIECEGDVTEIFLQPGGSAKLPVGYTVTDRCLRAHFKTLKVLEG